MSNRVNKNSEQMERCASIKRWFDSGSLLHLLKRSEMEDHFSLRLYRLPTRRPHSGARLGSALGPPLY